MDKHQAQKRFEEIKEMPTDTPASMQTTFKAMEKLLEELVGSEEHEQKDKGTRGGH
jgi:vacuolar-type H+-ATPase subunit D/Vma8